MCFVGSGHTPYQVDPGGLEPGDGDLALVAEVVGRLEVHKGEQGVGEHVVVTVHSGFPKER